MSDLDDYIKASHRLGTHNPSDLLRIAREGAEDTKRLDFLVEMRHMKVMGNSERGFVVWDQSHGLEAVGKGRTAREAIDDAMNRSHGK